jgi:hypothetical protein
MVFYSGGGFYGGIIACVAAFCPAPALHQRLAENNKAVDNWFSKL